MSRRMRLRLLSWLRPLLGRNGIAKIIVGWLYLLSIRYAVMSQLKVSSIPSTRLMTQDFVSVPTGQEDAGLNSTSIETSESAPPSVGTAWLLSLKAPLSLVRSAIDASWSTLHKATGFGSGEASRTLLIPSSTYYVDRPSQNAASDSGNALSFDSSSIPMTVAPSSTVTSIEYNSTYSSENVTRWVSLNWTSLPTQSRGGGKPIMYLHAGPYKTASSYLQCVLSRNAYEYLKMDGVTFLGACAYECKRPASTYDYCELHSSGSFFTRDRELQPQLLQKLNELRDSGQSALIVWEYLSDLNEQKLQNLLKALDGWEIHVILNYRRLYEWLPSWYSQKHRPLVGREQYSAWPGQSMVSGGNILRQTGALRFPFDMYSRHDRMKMPFDEAYTNSIDLLESTQLHPVDHARRHWLRYARNATITVLSLHHLPQPGNGNDPLLTYMFCNLIPLDNTCHAARNNLLEVLDEGSNERFPENYDLLAQRARQKGLHPNGDSSLSRPDVWKLIQSHQETTLNKSSHDFPLKCISKESLERLWNLSVVAERSILTGLEAEHKHEFDDAVQRKAFCSIDADQTLKLGDWLNFFRPATIILPHVTKRVGTGAWWPAWDSLHTSDQLYFSNLASSMHRARGAPDVRSVDIIGFLHVSQTNMDRLTDLVWNDSLPFTLESSERNSVPADHLIRKDPLLGCLFGVSALGMSYSVGGQRGCPLSRYSSLVQSWAENVDYLDMVSSLSERPPSGQRVSSVHASITPVILVRDPLDRWVEIYREWKSSNKSISGNLSFTPLQTRHDGGFEEFLRQMTSLPYRNRTLGNLQQFHYVAQDLDRAIDIVAGSTPRVLALVQECWDESLRLLHLHYSVPVPRDTTANAVIERPGVRTHETIGADLKDNARVWLASEYKFYDAAKKQFLRLLSASNETSFLADTCTARLRVLTLGKL